jgi:hypothetical protein
MNDIIKKFETKEADYLRKITDLKEDIFHIEKLSTEIDGSFFSFH